MCRTLQSFKEFPFKVRLKETSRKRRLCNQRLWDRKNNRDLNLTSKDPGPLKVFKVRGRKKTWRNGTRHLTVHGISFFYRGLCSD